MTKKWQPYRPKVTRDPQTGKRIAPSKYDFITEITRTPAQETEFQAKESARRLSTAKKDVEYRKMVEEGMKTPAGVALADMPKRDIAPEPSPPDTSQSTEAPYGRWEDGRPVTFMESGQASPVTAGDISMLVPGAGGMGLAAGLIKGVGKGLLKGAGKAGLKEGAEGLLGVATKETLTTASKTLAREAIAKNRVGQLMTKEFFQEAQAQGIKRPDIFWKQGYELTEFAAESLLKRVFNLKNMLKTAAAVTTGTGIGYGLRSYGKAKAAEKATQLSDSLGWIDDAISAVKNTDPSKPMWNYSLAKKEIDELNNSIMGYNVYVRRLNMLDVTGFLAVRDTLGKFTHAIEIDIPDKYNELERARLLAEIQQGQ